jgi:hypothetical protein
MGLDHIDLHYRSATATVALPHGPKSGLATQVPAVSYQQSEFDGDHTKTMASRTTKTDNATVDKEKRYITHHRNVTWPRVTFFMLKPTVGMELCHTRSLVTDKVFQMAARSWGGGTYSIVNSPPCATASAWTWDGGEGEGGEALLTESTRSSDVLPAFWRPIMVTSISVFLHRTRQRSSSASADRVLIVGEYVVAKER